MPSAANWADYLADFHAGRPGITEAVLSRAKSGHGTPYQWLARAVSASATTVVDVACGSGAMSRQLEREGRLVVGVDLSVEELAGARGQSRGPFVLADATSLPLADGCADAVTSSVGLAVVHPTGAMIEEVARVLRHGGVFAATVPSWRPLRVTDMRVGAKLARILRTPPRFPVTLEATIGPMLLAHGLRKVEDARERYRFNVANAEDAELLVSSLYLPTAGEKRLRAAVAWLSEEAEENGPVAVPIPMRRVVAIK